MDEGRLLSPVAGYYAGRLARFGCTPAGVDWRDAGAQQDRFARLCRLFPDLASFSLNDLGCGYGALYDHLVAEGRTVDYRGYDIVPAMLEAARARPRARGRPVFVPGSAPAEPADFSVASGIFNVRLDAPDAEWLDHVDRTLEALARASRRGFAFNCLAASVDPARRRPDLFYADAGRLADRCAARFAPAVTLLYDRDRVDFTLIVRKAAAP